jgi:hypothetical protein
LRNLQRVGFHGDVNSVPDQLTGSALSNLAGFPVADHVVVFGDLIG